MTLRTQLVLVQIAIVLALVLTTGLAAAWLQERQVRDAYQERMVAVAQSVAQLPTIVEAYDDVDPSAVIQPIAELIRDSSDVAYVVVTDAEGVRYSHPNPERIGELVSTDPSIPLSGEMYVGTQTGTLGKSWRVKVPVFGADGEVMGQVSVGILESDLRADFHGDAVWLLGALGIATVIGVVAAAAVARLVRRRIYGLEPDEIRGLLETREATLHGIREGLVALDERGAVSLCNDAAARLLGLNEPEDATGQTLAELVDADLDALLDVREGEETPQQLVLAGERVLVARASPMRVDDRHIGTVVILMDRTELDLALQRLAGAQSLAEGLRAQQHEFANTLHTLGGLVELGETEAALRLIGRAGGGGAISLLDAHAGVQEIEVSALILAKRARARERGVTLAVDADASLPEGAVAAEDLVMIVGNLLDNAVDAVERGGRVRLGFRRGDDALEIVVEDDGPGVRESERELIFHLGHTTKLGEQQRGYGLTLIARAVERLGGEVRVERGTWGGALFRVTLPCRVRSGAGA